MTLINKIREKSGWAIGVVAIALGLFVVGGDLLSPNSAILGEQQIVGKINGEKVGLREFSERVDQIRQNYQNNGITPDENLMPSIRQEAWRQMIFKYAYQSQFEELGLQITDAEITDMVQGNNIHPSVEQSFTNPETGVFDRQAVVNYLQNIRNDPTGAQVAMFANFEQSLRQDRLQAKYESLVGQSFYITDAEAQREYEKQNRRADVRYVYIPYASIPDSAISIEDSRLSAHFNANSEKYDQEANRELKYISIPVVPTDDDKRNIAASLSALQTQFATTANDTAFIQANSDGTENFLNVNPSQLPTPLASISLEKGEVKGPFQDGEAYKLYKVIDIVEDSIFSAKASHILFKVDENAEASAKAEVRAKALDILGKIRNEENTFEAMAMAHGEDGTRSRGGDLGWFTEGTMVTPFNDAVMSANTLGLLPNLVETQFGYHIIKITGLKTKQKYIIGVIQKDITASDETIDQAYRKAGRFSQYRTQKEFEDYVTSDSSLILYQALTVKQDGRNINNLTNPRVREIIRWAYNDAEVGDVSEIYDLDDQFLIAVLIGKSEKGLASFDKVKDQVKRDVLKEEKEQQIIDKINSLTWKSVDDLQQAYGTGAIVEESQDISLASTSLTRVGAAPMAIGAIAGLKEGAVSKPIADQNGVLVIEVIKTEEAVEVADLTSYKDQLLQRYRTGISFGLREAVEKFSDVENNISKYY